MIEIGRDRLVFGGGVPIKMPLVRDNQEGSVSAVIFGAGDPVVTIVYLYGLVDSAVVTGELKMRGAGGFAKLI